MPRPRSKIRQWFHIRREFLRRILWLCIVLLIGRILYGQIGKRVLRPVALRQIRLLGGAGISMGTVEFRGGRTVVIDNLIIRPPLESFDKRMLRAQTVEARFSLLSILTFRPRLKKIILTGAFINAQYDRDIRQWNMRDLNITQAALAGMKLPVIALEDSTVCFSTIKNEKTRTHIIARIDANFTWVPDTRGTYGFFIEVNDYPAFEGSYVRGVWRSGPTGSVIINEGCILMDKTPVLGNAWNITDLTFEAEYDQRDIICKRLRWRTGPKSRGSIQGVISNYADQADYALRIDLDDWLLTPKPTADALVYSKDVLELSGQGLGKFLEMYCPEGMVDLDVRASGKLSDLTAGTLTGTVHCDDISVCYTEFPYPLEHIVGTIEMPQATDAMDIIFENLRCSHGDVDMVISGNAVKVNDEWGYDVHLSSDNMGFDEELYQALDDRQKKLWDTFSLVGNVKFDYHFGRKPGGPSEGTLVVDLAGAAALYQHFPYPLENLTGTVIIERDQVTLKNIVSHYEDDDRIITLNGSVVGITSDHPRFNMVIDANSVPIDATLRAALPEKQRRFYEHFDMDAITDAVITVFPNEVDRRLVEYIARVRIRDASMVYHDFPVPMTDVDVDAELTADVIVLRKMTARSGPGRITVSGHIRPATERVAKPEYCLSIRADQLVLDPEWLCKLPKPAAEAAARLKPRGRINIAGNINVDSQKADCPEFGLNIECLGNSFYLEQLPRAFENVTGKIEITTAGVRIKNFRIPNIALDEHLGKVLGQNAGKAYKSIAPTGVVDLNIAEAWFSRDIRDGTQVDLTGNIILSDCGFDVLGGVGGMNGVAGFTASYRMDTGLLEGSADLSADSLTIKGRTLTDTHAAVVYNAQDSTFVSRDFSARFYGGRISGDAEITKRKTGNLHYRVHTVFDGIEFGNMMIAGPDLREGGMLAASKGLVSGSFNLQGITQQADSHTGRLNIGIRNMQLAKRSLLGKILAAMQLNNPTDYIFSDISVDAFVKGNNLVFQEVYMSGESTVLLGRGFIDLSNDELDLEFSSYGSVMTSRPSFLETLARGLGSAVIKVEVYGTIDRPRIVTTPLPVLTTPFSILGESP